MVCKILHKLKTIYAMQYINLNFAVHDIFTDMFLELIPILHNIASDTVDIHQSASTVNTLVTHIYSGNLYLVSF